LEAQLQTPRAKQGGMPGLVASMCMKPAAKNWVIHKLRRADKIAAAIGLDFSEMKQFA